MKRAIGMAAALTASVATTGCGRDPASEAPLELKPGRYQIAFEGAVAGFKIPGQADGPGSETHSICVTPAIAKKWPRALMSGGMGSGSEEFCSYKDVVRTGNALTGMLVCDGDEDRMPGSKVKLTYTGAMTDVSTALDAKMSFELPNPDEVDPKMADEIEQIRGAQPMLSAVSVVIKADRTGDCNENG